MLKKLFLIMMAFLITFTGVNWVEGVFSPDIEQKPRQFQTDPNHFTIEFFPTAPHYVGDTLSVRVTYSGQDEIANREISLFSGEELETPLARTQFSGFTQQAVFYWVLDTTKMDPGFVTFFFEVSEMGESWSKGLHLLPRPTHRQAEWAVVHTSCCTVHYLTETDAEADIKDIITILEDRTAVAIAQFFPDDDQAHLMLDEPLPIVLVPIVVGHGGFASNEAVLTYSKRNWAGIGLDILSHHEIVHVIDRQINPVDPRPSLFVEGVAVYLAGGHYREGDALLRAAALFDLGLYLPIDGIVNDFYAAQHEIGYMQAAALVAYLVEIWGWDTFVNFYFNLPDGPSDLAIINAALEDEFNTDLATLEADFITYLKTFTPDEEVKEDVRLTIEVYDTIRRYQTIAIPSAHFRTAWWPSISHMRDRGIVGDYAWREKAPFNIIIENLFLEIHTGFDRGNYSLIEKNLVLINSFLDAVEPEKTPLSHYVIGWPLPGVPRLLTQP